MNALWGYFWPCFAVGLLVGAVVGRVTFRRRSGREIRLAIGVAISLALAAIWHGPLGGANRFEAKVERQVHQLLVDYEMTQVTAHLHQHPLTRRVMLSGPADDFQRRGLVEYMDQIPGVGSATWSAGAGLPLMVEGLVVAVLGFLFGLLLAYLAELRRRYNAQWNW
jgi:membrane protease YdiL (CAAX protease family)